VWISYIDTDTSGTSETFTGVFDVTDDLVIIVREGTSGDPIKQFITTDTFTNADKTVNAIRTTDL